MKISRSKLVSVLCFTLALCVIIVVFIKDYNESKERIKTIEKIVNSEKLETANKEEIDTEKAEEVENIDKEVEEIVEPAIVYDGLTLEELSSKLDKTLSSTLSGKGHIYASYSLEKGVDPYLAVAITMEETGCAWGCSNLVVSCNNVGGMKGSGCGAYASFSSIDDGIRAFIDNIARNYVAYGLTTAETMNPKYAENPNWANNVNAYIERIKNK